LFENLSDGGHAHECVEAGEVVLRAFAEGGGRGCVAARCTSGVGVGVVEYIRLSHRGGRDEMAIYRCWKAGDPT
jgi:hypothetical protein